MALPNKVADGHAGDKIRKFKNSWELAAEGARDRHRFDRGSPEEC